MSKNDAPVHDNPEYVRPTIDQGLFQAVRLVDFTPPNLAVAMTRELDDTLDTNSGYTGGALRDQYRTAVAKEKNVKVKDHDFKLDITQTNVWDEMPKETLSEGIMHGIVEKLEANPRFERTSDLDVTRIGSMFFGNVTFDFRAGNNTRHGMDISMSKKNLVLPTVAMYGDAVINSIAMQLDENGEPDVMAHPLFAEHIKKRIYAIRVTHPADLARSMERVSEKLVRFPGYTVWNPEEYNLSLY